MSNLRPISEASASVTRQIAEAAIKYAEEQGDHEKAEKLRAIWAAFKDYTDVP